MPPEWDFNVNKMKYFRWLDIREDKLGVQMLEKVDVVQVIAAHSRLGSWSFTLLTHFFYPVQLRWVVSCRVLPLRRAHLFPDSRGAPSGFVRWWHSCKQHQVPLQQQSSTGGTRNVLGRVRPLEPGVYWWRNLRHWDQDGRIPIWPWWQHPQRCALPLLFQATTRGEKEGAIFFQKEAPKQTKMLWKGN